MKRTASSSSTNPERNHAHQVAILDAGAQYGKVIDRRLRELAIESILLPMNTPASLLQAYGAVIISGGPESVYDAKAPAFDPALFQIGVPLLGICYGMQLMSYVSGGKVEKKALREDGPQTIRIQTDSALFAGLQANQEVLMTHGDSVDQPGNGFRVTATSGELIAAIENPARQMYGVQFHPEVDLTLHGQTILANFLFEIAKLQPTYTMENRETKAIDEIRQQAGHHPVLVLVSGGVDSAVAAALVTKALDKDKVFALHIDTGFMRQHESRDVAVALRKLGLNLRVIEAADTFLNATTTINGQQTVPLHAVTDPEQKRKIIGDTYMRVAQQALEDMHLPLNDVFLVQGSLRPDLIESASRSISPTANTIKTHHNDTALVRQLREAGQVIEPLADYHKDEVRVLGESLGLPTEIVWRQPFPGPGLAIRILCAEQPYMTADFTQINTKLAELVPAGLHANLLPIRTVGVQGDGRSYSYGVALSSSAKSPDWSALLATARAIPKAIHQVNRVVYLFGAPPTEAITSITPTVLSADTIEQLRHADQIVNHILRDFKLLIKISQVPVILLPLPFGTAGNRSIAIRTMITRDFMTGVPALPGKEMPLAALNLMVKRILAEVPGISRVVYDLTSKPPGTTEWE